MSHIITLIATHKPLEESHVTRAAEMADAVSTHWLKQGVAADLRLNAAPPPEILQGLDAYCDAETIDMICQPAATRRKKLLISDMDSTMITVECIDELADFVGKKAEVAVITERAMNGELDFEAALTARVALLKGLPEAALEDCYRERVRMMPGAHALVSAMREAGGHCVLVSGGFSFFTRRVRAELGFHEDYSNTLEVKDGHLTGKVIPPILGKEMKLRLLQDSIHKLGITADETLAVGDGANDLPMLLAAGLGVAYHAKPVVRQQVSHHITHSDLSALMWVLGLLFNVDKYRNYS